MFDTVFFILQVVLQDLHLPKDNVLYLLTPDLCSPTDNTSNVDNGQV